jgi:hypothetical protein
MKSMDSRCQACHRPLKDPESIARHIGPVCFGKTVNGSGELSGDSGQLELDFTEPDPTVEEPVTVLVKPPPKRFSGLSMIEQHREACRIIDRWRYSNDDCEGDDLSDGLQIHVDC